MNEGMADTAAVRTTAIPGLVRKLALHPLPDVRRRSLSSIHFKLEHGLVSAREAGESGAVEAVLGALERGEGMQLAAATLTILSEDEAARRKILVRVRVCMSASAIFLHLKSKLRVEHTADAKNNHPINPVILTIFARLSLSLSLSLSTRVSRHWASRTVCAMDSHMPVPKEKMPG